MSGSGHARGSCLLANESATEAAGRSVADNLCGGILYLYGDLGAGKTTLLQILGTLDKATSKAHPELHINGISVTDLNDKALAKFRNENIGFIFQFHQLLPEFTALENVCIPAFIKGINKGDAEVKARKLLDFLGLSLALSPKEGWNSDDRRLRDLSYINALGRYSDCLDFYQLQSHGVPGGSVQPVEDVIKELGGEGLRRKLRDGKSPADRYPQSVRRLTNLVEVSECDTVIGGIERMLEKAALSTSVGVETDPHRVNLLTLHSTKGLEFSRVYVVGVEDNEMPGWREVKENNTSSIQEARRLVYVGMTRAKDRLVLTRTDERFGNFTGGGMFVDEIGINVIREENAVE